MSRSLPSSMTRIVFRECEFTEEFTVEARLSPWDIQPSEQRDMIANPAVWAWIDRNRVEVCSRVHRVQDRFTLILQIYADVDPTLATYYMLRWGNAERELFS